MKAKKSTKGKPKKFKKVAVIKDIVFADTATRLVKELTSWHSQLIAKIDRLREATSASHRISLLNEMLDIYNTAVKSQSIAEHMIGHAAKVYGHKS